MFKDRMDYIRQLFASENDAQKSAFASLTAENDRIAIYPEEGKLLQLLIRMINASKIVEIGTLGGYSALWMAEALPEDGVLYTLEKDPARAALSRKNTAHDPRIQLIEGDAMKTLATLRGPVYLVFIDADKLHYNDYLDWAEQNVRTGGLIIGDNTMLFDAVWHDEPVERVRPTAREALRQFNKRLADPAKYHGIMLPTTEGLTIAIKK